MSAAAIADLVTAILLVVVGIIGVILCAIVILTVLQNKGLQNPFTAIICFICGLHIAEYLIPLPMKVTGELLHMDIPKWSLDNSSCKFYNFAFYVLAYGVAYCLLVLVVDRYADAKKRGGWTEKFAIAVCAILTLLAVVVNAGVPAVYGLADAKSKASSCGLLSLKGATLGMFFFFVYIVPVLGSFGGITFISRYLKIRKEYQLGEEVNSLFLAKLAILIFAFASYAILRLIWHVDRLLLIGGLVFDIGDLVVQDIAEILWYLHGLLLAMFVIIVYPEFKDSVRALCCGPGMPPPAKYPSDDDLVLMPVVTTEADPDRFDTWPQMGGYQKPFRGSDASLGTSISSKVDTPTSPTWRVVRTLEREPKSGGLVEKVPVQKKEKKVKSPKPERRHKPSRGDSSARSRSSSPATDRGEDKIKSKRHRLFKKKKSKKSQSSADEGDY